MKRRLCWLSRGRKELFEIRLILATIFLISFRFARDFPPSAILLARVKRKLFLAILVDLRFREGDGVGKES